MQYLTEVAGPPASEAPSTWIFDRIEEWAKRFPDRFAFAVDHQDRIEEYGYSEVLKRADAIAAELKANKALPGERIGILMENIPQWVFVLLGAMRAGVVTVPLATTLPEPALRKIVEHSGCKLVFSDDANREMADRLRPYCADRAERLADDTTIIIYTSGTTGDPKGVQLTTGSLIHEIRGVLDMLEISSDHRILSVLPFSHVLPLIANGLGPLCVGAGVVFLSSISPQRIIEAFHRHRITLFICVPQFFYVLHKRIFAQVEASSYPLRVLFRLMMAVAKRLNSAELRRKLFSRIHKTIGPELRLLASGGSRFDTRVAQDLNTVGYTMLQAYGLTETAAAATATPPGANKVGTVGKPIQGVTIRVDAPNDEGVGEVWIRGPILMRGYFRDGVHTAEAIKDGWLHTGDLGFIDPEGNLAITGRSKDVIVLASGKNIYPEELELHYSQSPFIKEICIYGVTDDSAGPLGEKLHAIVVPDMDVFRERGQTAIMVMIRFEMENLSKQLPSYQRVLSLSLRNDPLPRTATRKLKRFEIQKEEAQRRQDTAGPRKTGEDHARLREGIGTVVAELVREAKPDAGPLDPSMHIELDLGFDSLARVELLGLMEARLGIHLDEQQVTRVYTLAELIEVLENSNRSETMMGRSWKEILDIAPSDELYKHYIFNTRQLLNPAWWVMLRTWKLLARVFFRLKYSGVEKIPAKLPFIICPNHESFLDGPLLLSFAPRRVINNVFILGYSDYWESAFSKRIAAACNIVAIDPNVNLVRAMQLGAAGLKRGKTLLVFPEGTRTIDGHLGEFRKGAAILSYELNVPIVPVGIRGTYESWPRGGSFRFHPVEFVIGDPIDPAAFRGEPDPHAAITEKLRNDVKVLSGDV